MPFDNFSEAVMPALLAARASQRRIRIWCAAASSGQEPYSLAMCLKEMAAKLAGWRVDIVATDISRDVLEKANAGIYSQFEVQRGLPVQQLMKYFVQSGRDLADRARHPRDGGFSAVQSAERFHAARQL